MNIIPGTARLYLANVGGRLVELTLLQMYSMMIAIHIFSLAGEARWRTRMKVKDLIVVCQSFLVLGRKRKGQEGHTVVA